MKNLFKQLSKKKFKDVFKSKPALALLTGVLIRLVLASFTEHRYDMYTWRLNQAFVYEYHINPFLLPDGYPPFFWSYTPLWLYILLAIYPIYAFFCHPAYPPNINSLWKSYEETKNLGEAYHSFIPQNLPLLDLLVKLPLIVSDILIAVVLFMFIKEVAEENKAYRASWIWILNPYVIWISSVWGMFDSIPALFTVLSLRYFLKERYDKSAFSLAVAILFKMYPLLLIPILTVIYYKKKKRITALVRYCLISIGTVLLVSFISYFSFAIFFGQNPLSTSATLMWHLFKGRASPDREGKNIFFGLTPLGIFSTIFTQLNIKSNIPISPILFSIAIILLSVKIYRKKSFDKKDVISYVIVAHFAIYLTYSVINEQYLIWILPFLLMLSAERKDSTIEYFYWTISLLAILFIFAHYQDMSYFISPYYIPHIYGYPGYLPYFIFFGVVAAALYSIGIKVVLKR